MNILVTGAKGFVGKNLCCALKNIRDGKDKRPKYQELLPLEIYEYDRDSTPDELKEYCDKADFVFNLAGVNRPKNTEEFMEGNFGFASTLLECLMAAGNDCPVMLASSTQASLEGRFAGSEYGKSKLAGEELFFEYGKRTGAKILVYRFPNLYGKWCKPNYNSAVATFCNGIANDIPITVNDPDVELDLLYIDDLVNELLNALTGCETREGNYCVAQPIDTATLGEIVAMLKGFKNARQDILIPDVTPGSFSKKLYSTYQSYLPVDAMSYSLEMHEDERGSFIELLHTADRGQVSINITRPEVTKGQHWHNTKWEKFCVVSGHGLIRIRRVGTDDDGKRYPVHEFEVHGDDPTMVEMVPGYTHSITNLSDSHDLVTVMWCNEAFDPDNPDTFFEEV